MSQSPPDTLGKYQIIREIARSNDIVYEGYDPVMNRRVAVKELAVPGGATQQQKEDRIKRFMREAKAAGSLVHPNIVTVYDVAEQSGRYYLAMEFLDGQTLRKTIEERGTLAADDAIEVAIEIAKALTFAHANGVVHRDVKPENIQILENGAIKLTDFGIARLTFEPNITMDGQVFGTPSYMSPEQINGKDIDARSDIFSLGIILYEMVSGKKPFTGDSVVTITYAIMNAQPNPIPGVSQPLWQVICKALDKTPHLRHPSCESFIAELKAAQRALSAPPQIQAHIAPAQPSYGQLANNPVTPYGTPNPLYNAALAGMPAQSAPPPAQQYNYAGAAPQTPIYAPYQPGGTAQVPQYYGQPYGGASQPAPQIPVYYPPPPRRPSISISPEASANLARFFMAVLIIGGICGLLIFGLNTIAKSTQEITGRKVASTGTAQTSPRPSEPQRGSPSSGQAKQAAPDAAKPESPAQTPEETVNVSNQPTGNPDSIMMDAETLVDEGAQTDIAQIRDERWRNANEKFRDAGIISPNRKQEFEERARSKYIQISDYLARNNDRPAARAALYQAQAFSTTDLQLADVRNKLSQLGG